jgi:hypothetical protein
MALGGNVVEARVPLFFNSDVLMGVVRPTEGLPANTFYRNSEGDEMLFVHEGAGIGLIMAWHLHHGTPADETHQPGARQSDPLMPP